MIFIPGTNISELSRCGENFISDVYKKNQSKSLIKTKSKNQGKQRRNKLYKSNVKRDVVFTTIENGTSAKHYQKY